MLVRDFLATFSDLLRLAGPVVGLIIALAAWRRFHFPGRGKFVWGFASLAFADLFRFVVRETPLRESFLMTRERVSDVPPATWIAGSLGTVGLILVVLAMRSLLTAASASLSGRQTGGGE